MHWPPLRSFLSLGLNFLISCHDNVTYLSLQTGPSKGRSQKKGQKGRLTAFFAHWKRAPKNPSPSGVSQGCDDPGDNTHWKSFFRYLTLRVHALHELPFRKWEAQRIRIIRIRVSKISQITNRLFQEGRI